ncbi:MAG: acyl-ACP--UDP-N-acetylglucosamine O-acyltransferase [Candidatus Omnitrophica bacterium]|nr:acyl-ACP--UDP-N-acetylglucosamine O-acyltransferase [Candidatus Omnitrophota bacterium]
MIHPTAIIDPEVILGADVEVGAYARLEKGVKLADGVVVSPYVHIKGDTTIGANTFIATGAVLGEVPQILGVRQAAGVLRIGKDNVVREYVTVHGSSSPAKVTSIGDNNFFMACSHVAHDCRIANNVVVCNGALVAGHVEIDDRAFISGNVVIHQFVRIGRLAMIAGLARVNQDVPPFMLVVGDSRVWGVNLVGLQRAGFSREEIAQVRRAHQLLFRSKVSVKNALEQLSGPRQSPVIKELVGFIHSSKRGICGPRKDSFWERIFLDYPYYVRSRVETYGILQKRNECGTDMFLRKESQKN